MLEVIDSLADMETLRTIWQELERNPEMRGFQTYAWCRAAAETCARQGRLCIAHWHREGTATQVIFPGWVDRRGNWRLIGDEIGDVGDCVYAETKENVSQAYREFAEWVGHQKGIKRVWIQKLEGQRSTLANLVAAFHGSIVFRDHLRGQLVSDRTDDFIGGQTHLKQRGRRHLQAIAAKSDGLRLEIVNDPVKALDDMRALAQVMVAKRWRRADWIDERICRVVKAMMAEGLMEVAELVGDDGVQALGLKIVKTAQSDAWLCLYREKDLVTSLHVRYMARKVKDSPWRFDFGVGVYDYKWQSFRPEAHASFTFRYSKGWLGKTWDLVRMNVRILRSLR